MTQAKSDLIFTLAVVFLLGVLLGLMLPDMAHSQETFNRARIVGQTLQGTAGTYPLRFEGNPQTRFGWISQSTGQTKPSFGVQLTDDVNCDRKTGFREKTRTEIEIARIDLNQLHTFKFDFWIHPTSSHKIRRPTIFWQAWQNHDVKKGPRFPPIALEFLPNKQDAYSWSVRQAQNGKPPGKKLDSVDFPHTLEKGKWHTFEITIRVDPSDNADSFVRIKLNDVVEYLANDAHMIGYTPTADIKDFLEVRIGAYRGHFCRSPAQSAGRVAVFFDNVEVR